MTKIRIFPHRPGSKGAKALADALGGKVLRREGSKYRQGEGDFIVNWGASDCPFRGPNVANQPDNLTAATNKLTCLQTLRAENVRVPDFWTRREDIPDDAFPIVCRTILQGSGGAGIVIADRRDQLVAAPLYVKYVKKQDEYRIHAFRTREAGTSIISSQRKARRAGVEEIDSRVRNLENGYVFVRGGVEPPADVNNQAVAALEALGLAFGAVDVIWNERQQRAYVLEINTAPGLEGQTVTDYAAAFRGAMT